MSGSSPKSTLYVVGSEPPSKREAKAWGALVWRLYGSVPGSAPAQEARLEFAGKIRSNLEIFVPLTVPTRPPTMASDRELLRLLSQRRASGRDFSQKNQKAVGLLGKWRYAVWQREAQNAGRLSTLARALLIFREAGDIRRKDLEDWMVARWRLELPPEVPDKHLERWAERKTRRLELLPVHLRTEEPPKGWRLAQPKDEEVEPEEFKDA
jgi:hypothetical protein